MHTITLAELRAFIVAQPNERPVALYEGKADSPVGCVLNHYCKEKQINFHHCSFNKAHIGRGIDLKITFSVQDSGHGILDLIQSLEVKEEEAIANYGELKKVLLPV